MPKSIFINAGHGGTDPGACSKSGTQEAKITKKVCDILCDRLRLNYYPVSFYQQNKNVYEVSREENKTKSCLFISVHCNASVDKAACGVEVLFKTEKAKQFAKIMLDEIVDATGLNSRGIKKRENLHVLNKTKAPAILIELAFISNEKEEQLLKTQPEMFANAIWEAIKIYRKEELITF